MGDFRLKLLGAFDSSSQLLGQEPNETQTETESEPSRAHLFVQPQLSLNRSKEFQVSQNLAKACL